MTSNPLAARRAEPVYQQVDAQARCNVLNGYDLTHKMGKFYFVKETMSSATGEMVQAIEGMDLPIGTKGWIRENTSRVKGLIRKMTGGEPWLVDEIYQRAIDAAPVPIPWEKMRVV